MLASLLLLFSTALAQETPSAVRLCADAAEGAELEVCLALVAENPSAVDGIDAALRAHLDRRDAGDRELLRGLLGLSLPDKAADAAARLADLGDSRAVPALLVAASSGTSDAELAALHAVARFDESHATLAAWLLDAERTPEQRIAIARILADVGGATAGDALLSVARRQRTRHAVRDVVLTELQEHFPERWSELDTPVRRDGTAYLLATGATVGGQIFGATGHFSRLVLPGAGTGLGVFVGGTGGWVYGRARPIEARESLFVASTTVAGVTAGALIGAGLTDGSDDGAWGGSTVGNAAGLSLGLAFRRAPNRSMGDVWEANALSMTLGVALGTGLPFFRKSGWRAQIQPDDTGIGWSYLGAGLGTGAGALIGHWVAPHVDLSGPDIVLMSLMGAYGLGIGVATPVPNFRRGLPATGLAVGLAAGYALGAVSEPRVDALAGAATGAVFGGGMGTGLGLLVDADASSGGSVARGFALVGSGVGLATGSLAGTDNPELFDSADVLFVSLATGIASLQSAALYTAITPPFRTRGWFVLAPATIGAAAALSTPLVDIPITYSLTSASMGAWGGWFTYGISRSLGSIRRDQFLYSIVAADVGIALGLLAGGPPFNMPPLVVGLADGGAIVGGLVAAAGAVVIGLDDDGVVTIATAGSGVGLALGLGIGIAVHAAGGQRDLALSVPSLPLPGRWTVVPTGVSTGDAVAPGVQIQAVGW